LTYPVPLALALVWTDLSLIIKKNYGLRQEGISSWFGPSSISFISHEAIIVITRRLRARAAAFYC